MSHHCHFRVTPPTASYDLSGALAHADKYVVYEEVGEVTNKLHLHIYIESNASESTLKSDIRSGFRIPVGQKGKASAYFCCKYDAYKDPSPAYVAKSGKCIASQGYTAEMLSQYEKTGLDRYVTKTPIIVKDKAVPKSEFDILLYAFEALEARRSYTMPAIIRWIKSEYLSRRRCVPRSGDSSRYAYSLYAIIQGNTLEHDIGLNDSHYELAFQRPL